MDNDELEARRSLQQRITIFGGEPDRRLVQTASVQGVPVLIWSRENRSAARPKGGDARSFLSQATSSPESVGVSVSGGFVEFATGRSQNDARSAWRLGGSGAPERVALSGSRSLGERDHYLVPLNLEAEQRLAALMDGLELLPTDQRRNVIQVMARPEMLAQMYSLEYKMDQVLAGLGSAGGRGTLGPVAAAPVEMKGQSSRSEERGKWWDRIPDWALYVVAGIVLVAILGFVIQQLYFPAKSPETAEVHKSGKIEKPKATDNNTDQPLSQQEISGPLVVDQPSSPFEDSVRELANAMRSSSVPDVEKLRSIHDLTRFKDFAEAVVELELLKLGLIKDPLTTKDDFDNASKAALAHPGNSKAIRGGDISLLHFLLCQAGKTDRFLETQIPSNTPGCMTPENPSFVRAGFEALTKFAKTGQ